MFKYFLLLGSIFLFACEEAIDTPTPPQEEIPADTELYFPPNGQDNWESISPTELGWNEAEIPNLLDLLESNDSRAFLLLKDGKIVLESYFSKDLRGEQDFDKDTYWYWASAGKTLTAFCIGLAQQEGLLNLDNKSSDYLGENWTSLNKEQEDKINIWHQLTMTTGLDDGVSNSDSYAVEDLIYKSEAGSRWAYHNAPYTLLDAVLEAASGEEFEPYFNRKLRDRIGMDGLWFWSNGNHVYSSTARSMARFGLLIQNQAKWKEETILEDVDFFTEMITPSQEINESYGYLWWLNGQPSFMLPQSQLRLSGSLHPSAPDDMISAIGKNSQYLSIVPSKGLVLVRMGGNPENSLVPILFQDEIWQALNKILP
ncbi:MAG: serine hydrolase domain-containing protein [Bacteroidota bacterium]